MQINSTNKLHLDTNWFCLLVLLSQGDDTVSVYQFTVWNIYKIAFAQPMAELVGAGEVNRCGPCWKMPSYNAAGCLRFGVTDRRRDGLREEDGCRVVPNLKFRIYFTTSRNMPEKKKTNRNATKKQNLWRDF